MAEIRTPAQVARAVADACPDETVTPEAVLSPQRGRPAQAHARWVAMWVWTQQHGLRPEWTVVGRAFGRHRSVAAWNVKYVQNLVDHHPADPLARLARRAQQNLRRMAAA